MRRFIIASMGVALAVTTAACDGGASAVETRERAEADAASLAQPLAAPVEDVAEAPAATAAKPALTANRSETSDVKTARLFRTNGADFGAASEGDYVRMVHAFIASPPPGTERVTRANGDVIFYQPSTNTFAVVDREGAPRTMFKPREGAAYWERQKAQAPTFGRRRASTAD